MHPILQEAKAISGEIIAWRRQVHQNPELGMELPQTKQFVLETLREMGYNPQPIGRCGVQALVGTGEIPKTILIRADMDALPVTEETGLAFASKNPGVMHACGHDTHTAMLLGAAKLLKAREREIRGRVKLLFQPGEEIMEGAKDVVDAGILDNPAVDAAMMVHIISGSQFPSGGFAVFGGGPGYASVDWFRIHIQGKGSHGAQPEASVNPLAIMTGIYTSINELVAMGIPSHEQAVVTVGEMHGGNTGNVIPDTGYMTGTIRTFDETLRSDIKEKLTAIVHSHAEARGGKADIRFYNSAPSVRCDGALSAKVLDSLRRLVGDEKAVELQDFLGGACRTTSSEDFAYIAEKVPGTVVWFMAGTPDEGFTYPGHHPKVDYNEDVLYLGAAAYAFGAMDLLEP